MSKHQDLPSDARVLLVGAGRVGTALVSLLSRQGFSPIGVASRTPASAQHAAAFLGAPVVGLDELPRAELVIIGAVDHAIASLATSVAPSLSAGARVVHLSGASGVRPLEVVTSAGGIGWALHPVQACPSIEAAVERLPRSAWGVTASSDLGGAMSFVRERLDGTPVQVGEEARPLWHAASVMTSNGISGLLAFGEEILARIGIDEPAKVLGPLASGTVANALSGGGGSATLTGPIVRGEVETIRKHLAGLEGAPDLIDRYRLVARMILAAAEPTGRLDPSARRVMEELL